MSLPRKPARVLRAAEVTASSMTFQHPWNPSSQMHGAMLGRPAGLERAGINLIRVPPGKESFPLHAHVHEEEWTYILSGRATVESGDAVHEVATGDFVAFPSPSAPHLLRNASSEDVVYLAGGEHAHLDVVDFPRDNKRSVRIGDRSAVYELSSGTAFPFPGFEKL